MSEKCSYKNLLIILLWSLWISAPYFIFGGSSYVRVHDNAESNLVYRSVLAQTFVDKGLCYWMPQPACGVDALASGCTGFFTSDLIPFLILPDWLACFFIVFLQKFLAAYFTFRLCRDFLNFKSKAAILAGLFWSLGTWTTNDWALFDRFGTPLVPLYLWLLENALQKKGIRMGAYAAAGGLLLSFGASFALTTPFFIGGAFFWFLIVRKKHIKPLILAFLIFGVFSFVWAIPELWAIGVHAPLSGRRYAAGQPIALSLAMTNMLDGMRIYFKQYAFHWAIAILGILFLRPLNKKAIRYAGFAIGLVLCSKLLWVVSVTNRSHLGILSYLNFNDFILLGMFIPSIAAACAVGQFEWVSVNNKSSVRRSRLLFLIALACICVKSAHINLKLLTRIPSDNYSVNYRNPDLLALAEKTKGDIFRTATAGISNASAFSASNKKVFPAYAQVYGFETVDSYLSLYSKRYQDYWGQVLGPLRQIDAKADSRWLNRPMWIYLYAPFDGSFNEVGSIEFGKYYNLNLLSLANTKYLISRWLLDDKNLKLVNNPEHVKAVRDKWETTSRLDKLSSMVKGDMLHRALYIYENTKSLPRTFVVHKTKFFDSDQALLTALGEASLENLETTIYLNSENGVCSDVDGTNTTYSSSAQIVEYEPDKLVVSVESDAPGYLVLTNNYSPYWECFVDGIITKIVPAYHTFQAVCVPAGKSVISFQYRPPYFFYGRQLNGE